MQRVRIIVDEQVPAGKVAVGGVRILPGGLSDTAFGQELRTVEVRCAGKGVATLIWTLEHDPDVEVVVDEV